MNMSAGGVDVTDTLRGERAALLDLLSALQPDQWDAPTECPAWSVHGVAQHVLGDDLSLLARQRDEATNGLFLYAEDHAGLDFRQLLDGFNEQWVTAVRFFSPRVTMEMLAWSGDATADFYETVGLDTEGEPVGFFGSHGPTPYRLIAAREYVERWVHQHQIRRAAGQADLGDEFLIPSMAAITESLAGNLPTFESPEGTTLAMAVDGLGAWHIRRDGEGWKLDAGGSDADVTIRIPHDRATTVISRGLARDDAAAELTVEGDPELGQSILGVVCHMTGQPTVES